MLFPELVGKPYGYLNLNRCAKVWLEQRNYSTTDGINPLLDATVCQNMVAWWHTKLGIDYSWGGWLEDRSTLWRGSYLEEEHKFTHLGIDLNVPAGTLIAAHREMKVLHFDDDHPARHGWGPRLFVQLTDEPVVLVYAHLGRWPERLQGTLRAGEVFAHVGAPPYNGGWYSHLHVQCMPLAEYLQYTKHGHLQTLDGYATGATAELKNRFPDPMQYLSLL